MKKFIVVSCVLLLIFTSSFIHAANCAWWRNLNNSKQSSSKIKFGYVMGAYGAIGDLYGMLYSIDDTPIVKVKEFIATKESINVIIVSVDIFCEERKNAFVSIPYYLEMILQAEAEMIRREDMSYKEEILRELLGVESPPVKNP